VNTHLQLLWNSVFAPRAAVDLAKQHPDTYKLGWIYVAAMIAASFIAELIARYVVRPFVGAVVENTNDPMSWLDSIAGATTLSVIVSIMLFLGQRWFWRNFASASVSQSEIDAAIISTFALSIVLVLPQYIVSEFTQNASGSVAAIELAIQFAIYTALATVYFSHGLGISIQKSFWLNCLVFLLITVVAVTIFFFAFVAVSVLTGTSLDTLFAVEETPA
jgi:hypothetical protein